MAKLAIAARALFVLVVGCTSSPNQEYDFTDLSIHPQRLYFTDLSKVERFNTVTVFLSNAEMDLKIADVFWEFARAIGDDNGATRVQATEYPRYVEFISRFNCRTVRASDIPAVVFVARKSQSCYVFSLSNPAALREVLYTIQRNLNCPRDMRLEWVGQEARTALVELTNGLEAARPLLRPGNQIIDFLVERLRNTCKR